MIHPYTMFSRYTDQHDIESNISADYISRHFTKEELSLMDVGCGSGLLLKKIASKTKKHLLVDYIDPDKNFLKLFKRTLVDIENVVLNKEFCIRIEKIISKSISKYDIILCGHCFYYLELGIIKKLHELLNPGGVLIIHISKKDAPSQKLFSIAIDKKSSEDLKEYLTKHQMRYQLRSVKFHVNVTPIKKYLENPSETEGKNFLEIFLYNKRDQKIIRKIKNLIERYALVKNNSYYLQGTSNIYFIE